MSSIEIIPPETRSRGLGLMAAAAVVYLALHLAGFHSLFAEDREGIGALLEIVGTLYSVVYAFTSFGGSLPRLRTKP